MVNKPQILETIQFLINYIIPVIIIGLCIVSIGFWITFGIVILMGLFQFRSRLELNKNHKIHIKLDTYGSIQVFDNSLELLAIIYKDRTIEYKRELSFFKLSKIKNVSDHFEEYEFDLKVKEDSICL